MRSYQHGVQQCTKPGCSNLTRPSHFTAKENPGTHLRNGNGQCVMCSTDKAALCVNEDCRHPLRRASTPVAAAPGTRPRGGGGMCARCWLRTKPKVPVVREPVVEVTAASVEYTARGLEAFLERRRQRMARFAA